MKASGRCGHSCPRIGTSAASLHWKPCAVAPAPRNKLGRRHGCVTAMWAIIQDEEPR